jgi:hypothetical protein
MRSRAWISHWDLRSVTVLLQGLYGFASASRLQVELAEVPLRQKPNAGKLRRSNWWRLADAPASKQSLIAIGSPKACHAAELMLAKMFDCAPFAGPSHPQQCPFSFLWTKSQLDQVPSSFARVFEPKKKPPPGFTSLALRFGDDSFVVPYDKRRWHDYGVIAAQRRPPQGAIWLVCAGLSGPATFAAAQLFAQEHLELPPIDSSSGCSQVVCRAVKAEIVRDNRREEGDHRRVVAAEFFGDPAIWSPPSNATSRPSGADAL